jgi:hypothetical protein
MRVIILCLGLLASGCASETQTPSEPAKVIETLLGVLSSDGRRVCVDAKTQGKPLAVFSTMIVAPRPSRRPLQWQIPKPLRPPGPLSNRELYEDEFARARILLEKPVNARDVLPPEQQLQLNSVARTLAAVGDVERVSIANSPKRPLIVARWWLANRVRPLCVPNFTISNPVVAREIAFVSVTGGHWGTTYAFRKRGDRWAPHAQWTTWLY